MRERVGQCKTCGAPIYCEDGFFNGILLPGHQYLCMSCHDEQTDHQQPTEDKNKSP